LASLRQNISPAICCFGSSPTYRLQADRLGDLDAETLKVLKQAAGQEGPASAVSKNLARLSPCHHRNQME
jgi:hypothetical protein